MTHEERQEMIKSIRATGRRMKRDKKFRIAYLNRLGILTPKGNLTRAWRQYKKWFLANSVPIQPGQD